MYSQTKQLYDHFTRLWHECSAETPGLRTSFTPEQQLIRETGLDDMMTKLDAFAEMYPNANGNRPMIKKQLFQLLRESAGSLLGFEQDQMDIVFSTDSAKSAVDFIKSAKAYDPELDNASLYQAARNVWAMNGLQYLFGLPVKLTPSIFAYSLLYPYTDNYLDNPAISSSVKSRFNERFGRRINGERVKAVNAYEERVFDLIGKIESQWSRKKYPQVYESLIAIHIAQIKSLALVHHKEEAGQIDVSGICIEKGGTSVLADGYLIAGDLTDAQKEFLYGYGAYLQLVDDLQDVKEDQANSLMTIFSGVKDQKRLDELTNKTFHFGAHVMQSLVFIGSPQVQPLVKVFENTAVSLLIDAAGRSIEFYSPEYRGMLAKHSPLRLEYMAARRQNMDKRKDRMKDWMKIFAD